MASKAPATTAAAKKAAPVASPAVAKRDNKANNYIAVVAVIAVVVVVACGLVVRALLGTIILNGKLIGYTSQANTDLHTKLKNIPILINNYNALGSNQQLLSDAVPTSADFPALVSISQAMSADAGVVLSSVSPDTTTGTTSTAPATGTVPVTPYSFDVQISGTYAQVVQFFKDVQLSARPMKVVSTQISGDSSSLQVSATIQTYYQAAANTADQTETLK